MQIAELNRIPRFAGVATDVLAAVLPGLSQKTFLPNDVICRAGDPAHELFVILHGHVEVAIDGTTIVPRGEYDLIGEQGLLNGGLRTATVVARTRVSALAVPAEAFGRLIEERVFVVNLARILSAKLAQATADRAFHYSSEARVFGEFRAHVAPEVLNSLLEDPDKYAAPRNTEVVVMFSDIRDFTGISRGMSPHQVASDLTGSLVSASRTRNRSVSLPVRCKPFPEKGDSWLQGEKVEKVENVESLLCAKGAPC